MKRVMLLVVSILLCVAALAQQRSIQSLVGRWEAIRGAEGGGLEVVDSTSLYLVYDIEKKKIVSYKADFSVTPARFDFVVKDSTETLQLKSLLEFVNNDLIKWQLFEGDVLPVHFVNDIAEILYLRRKK